MTAAIYSISVKDIQGKDLVMEQFKDKVLLIVNTASKCGFTPQYKALEDLYQQYKDRGLVILGFPCNQFGKQEQGNEDEISQFCQLSFGVTFPLFSKIEVNGNNSHPLYQHLKKSAKGLLGSESIKWNFTKFLVDKQGNILERYAPTTKPEELNTIIEKLLS
ncbi:MULTISPECIES: glutathione peroxidase [Shewanella]|uniref:glutathione peroxidase n=1 Tax=Shewanella TaxID=22 RepID=UPI000C65CBB2|nr:MULTISPECIES: glutathione peroxidase [Shewanella]NCQ44465.1 glutathione peroxidase [Shewanella frigidimarina]NCO72128.1 glutathione peroxidase [Shewanella vesiculosa]NCP35808.1 glutathione peroxidase [Shewanella vesiculosa]NCP68805.1 glutathione peroxidase [Shewanella vesiculosa]NCP73472.1 glutathione peroxidase [Shewanella vesiculosa]